MNKQEEIREGIKAILASDLSVHIQAKGLSLDQSDFTSALDNAWEERVNEILSYLHSQGVVIKVDGELPELLISDEGVYAVKHDSKAGYTKTEPLVKK